MAAFFHVPTLMDALQAIEVHVIRLNTEGGFNRTNSECDRYDFYGALCLALTVPGVFPDHGMAWFPSCRLETKEQKS